MLPLRVRGLVALCRPLESGPFVGVAGLGLLVAGVRPLPWSDGLRAVLAAAALAIFAFAFNDLCDRSDDRLAPHKQHRPLLDGRVSPRAAGWLCLVAAVAPFLLLAGHAAASSAALVALACGWAYSAPATRGKHRPGLATALHLGFGAACFAVGAWMAAFDPRLLAVGAHVGLLFAAGHLHHEAEDLEADRAAGRRTTATRLGAERALLLGAITWAMAPLPPLAAGLLGWIAFELAAVMLVMALGYALVHRAARRRHREVAPAVRAMRRGYRPLYWLGGVALLALAW